MSERPASVPATGNVPLIPGYELEQLVGRGATGTVWRARQLAVDREVALKLLHPELAQKPRVIQRLQREARTTARLAHPHIVSAIDMGETNGRWWFAMEFVDGPSLALRLRQEGRLSEREALRLFIPLCEALVHMAENGVVHRDIKPANILIDKKGGARIADLGLAWSQGDLSLTRNEGTLGTPHYISPEQARDPHAVDSQSDIWSFGATLFHSVCGRPPFQGESLAEILSAVLHGPVPDPGELEPELSAGLALVLRKCLTRDPARRYQHPQELLLDLERVRERRAPKVRRRALEPVAGQWSREARLLVWTAVVGALMLGAWLTLEKPWRDQAALQRYAPLEALAPALEGDPELLAPALAKLEALQLEVPPGQTARWRELRSALRERVRGEVEALQAETEAAVEAELSRRDAVAARAALARALEQELPARTGTTREGLARDFQAWVELLQARIGASEQRFLSALDLDVGRFLENQVFAQVQQLESQSRWRDAQALLTRGPAALLAAAGLDTAGLPAAALAGLEAGWRARCDERARQLLQDWTLVQEDLAAYVELRSEEWAKRLRNRQVARGTASELRSEYNAELAQRGLDPRQFPDGQTALATKLLDERAAGLLKLEQDLREADVTEGEAVLDALAGFVDSSIAARTWSARDYPAARSAWQDWGRELIDLERPEAEGRSLWSTRAREIVDRRVREAELLDSLLTRALQGARRRAGQAYELGAGLIRISGVLAVGADPLEDGFLLQGTSGAPSTRFFLRLPKSGATASSVQVTLVGPADLEALAGLPAAGEAIADPLDRLASALFRLREGDPQTARKALVSGALPEAEQDLVEDLEARLAAFERRSAEELQHRGAQAATLFDLLGDEQRSLDPTSARERIDYLLQEYADTPLVLAQRTQLLAWREELSRRLAQPVQPLSAEDLQALFQPNTLEQLDKKLVRMHWDFTNLEAGAFERGSWEADGEGWIAAYGRMRPVDDEGAWAELLRRPGPRLVLRSPLELELQPVVIELDLTQPLESGPPRLFVLSAAGFHLALVGSGLTGADPRLLVTTGSLEEHLARVRSGEGRSSAAGLRSGSTHHLRVEFQRRGGRYKVDLDGQRLSAASLPSPGERASTRSLALYSWEPVRLEALTLTVGRN